jgi:hypothetical protein
MSRAAIPSAVDVTVNSPISAFVGSPGMPAWTMSSCAWPRSFSDCEIPPNECIAPRGINSVAKKVAPASRPRYEMRLCTLFKFAVLDCVYEKLASADNGFAN